MRPTQAGPGTDSTVNRTGPSTLISVSVLRFVLGFKEAMQSAGATAVLSDPTQTSAETHGRHRAAGPPPHAPRRQPRSDLLAVNLGRIFLSLGSSVVSRIFVVNLGRIFVAFLRPVPHRMRRAVNLGRIFNSRSRSDLQLPIFNSRVSSRRFHRLFALPRINHRRIANP